MNTGITLIFNFRFWFLAIFFSSTLNANDCVERYNKFGCNESSSDLGNGLSIKQYSVIHDNDQDGVSDVVDKCLDTKKGAKVNSNGCEIKKTLVVLLEGEKLGTSIVVQTKKGKVEVDQVNYVTEITSSDSLPSKPKPASKKLLSDISNLKFDFKMKSFVLYFDNKQLVDQSEIESLIQEIMKRDKPYIKIIGHTDTVGTQEQNEIVGLRRAQFVEKLINDSGTTYLKMDVTSHAESDLAVQTEDNVYEKANRRVEVFIY